jgi:hypothetical protein
MTVLLRSFGIVVFILLLTPSLITLVSAQTTLSSCQNISNSGNFELDQAVTNESTCFTIDASDVALDCNGYEIEFGNASEGTGVLVVGQSNVSVMNCRIQDPSEGDVSGIGINFTGTVRSLILNNTVITNGTTNNYGIFLLHGANNNSIVNNTVRTRGTGTSNYGIVLFNVSRVNVTGNVVQTNGTDFNYGIFLPTTSSNNSIVNNSVLTNGDSASNFGIYAFTLSHDNWLVSNFINTNGTSNNYGIRIQERSNFTIVANNTITTSGVTGNIGIYLQPFASHTLVEGNSIFTNGNSKNHGIEISSGSPFNTVRHNTIITNGTAAGANMGIYIRTRNNTITNNTITTFGNSSHAVLLEKASNFNIFLGNNLTTHDNSSYAFYLTASNTSTFNNSILSSPVEWIFVGSNALNHSFVNTTFTNPHGRIQYTLNFTLSGLTNISQSKLNITNNNVSLNTTNIVSLNQSAIITIYNLTFDEPKPLIDLNDDGAFDDCSLSTTPICENLSYAAGVFVFNVTHFSSYSAGAVATITFTSPSNASSFNSNFNISENITGVNIDFVMYEVRNSSRNLINWTNQTNQSNVEWTSLINISGFADGNYMIFKNVTDDGGNEVAAVLDFTVDTTTPSITSFSCNYINVGNAVSCSCEAADVLDSSVEITVDDGGSSSPGTYSAQCTATDDAGNIEQASVSYSVTSDGGGSPIGGGGGRRFRPANATNTTTITEVVAPMVPSVEPEVEASPEPELEPAEFFSEEEESGISTESILMWSILGYMSAGLAVVGVMLYRQRKLV